MALLRQTLRATMAAATLMERICRVCCGSASVLAGGRVVACTQRVSLRRAVLMAPQQPLLDAPIRDQLSFGAHPGRDRF